MMKKILITYVTKTGTTEHTANIIAEELASKGHLTTVLPISKVESLEGFDQVIVGGPINGMQWHPDAFKFIESNASTLKDQMIACYFVSYMLDAARPFWNSKLKATFEDLSQKYSLKQIGMFKGRVTEELPGPMRFMFGIKKGMEKDRTNDEDVRLWSKELALKL